MKVLIIVRTGDGLDALNLEIDLQRDRVEVDYINYPELRSCGGVYDLVVLFGLTEAEHEAFATARWVRVAVGGSPLLIISYWRPQEHDIAARLKQEVGAEYMYRCNLGSAFLAKAREMLGIKKPPDR